MYLRKSVFVVDIGLELFFLCTELLILLCQVRNALVDGFFLLSGLVVFAGQVPLGAKKGTRLYPRYFWCELIACMACQVVVTYSPRTL